MKFILIFIGIIYVAIVVIFYGLQEFFIFHPKKTDQDFQYKFPTKFTEKFHLADDGAKIHSVHFYTTKPRKGVIFYLHGNSGSIEDWGWLYADFIDKGYDLKLIDYRTYGKSSGKLSQKALFSDAQTIYTDLLLEFSEDEVIVFGRSIGTGIAAYLAAQNSPKQLILESPYFNLTSVVRKIVPFIPIRLVLKYKLDTNKYLAKVNCPIYAMHGVEDVVIKYSNSQKLKKVFGDKITLLTVLKGGHNDLGTFKIYQDFLDKVLE